MSGPSYFLITSKNLHTITLSPMYNLSHTYMYQIHAQGTFYRTNPGTHTNTNFPQVMDSQMNSELFDKLLDKGMILMAGGDSDDKFWEDDLE